MTLGLRVIAIAIAVAGLVDPAWTVSRPQPQKLIAIRMTAEAPAAIEQAMRANLPGWEIEVRDSQSRLPCAHGEHCVAIADGSIDANVPDDLSKPLSLITMPAGDAPNVSIRSVAVSGAHQDAAGVARVTLSGNGVEKRKAEIRILDGAAVIGSATHEWSGPDATVDVPWWPIGIGARTLSIDVVPLEGEHVTFDNHLDIGVSVASTRSPILVFDARPSWSSTFVRRAIEDDARFSVGYRTRLAPALSAGTASGRLDAAALDLASVVVIGGPDALTASDVTLLEQFVGVRGGTLILLPERAPSGPWTKLLSAQWAEHLTTKPEAVGSLKATEVLRTDRLPATSTVLAQSGALASIAVSPSGNGRVVMSGAMDAWRYRDLEAGVFDKFWRSVIAEGAAAGAATQLLFDQPLGARGSRARFTIRARRMSPDATSSASATALCGDAPAYAIRLWPSGIKGEFFGELPLFANGACRIDAMVNDRPVTGSIAVAERPRRGVEPTLSNLEHRVRATGGAVVRAGEEASLARVLTAATPPAFVATAIHPMRAGWWMVLFAGCLSLEWWLRRRSGLR